MREKRFAAFNTKLGLGITIASAVLIFLVLVLLFVMPTETLSAIDRPSIKVILFVMNLAVVALAGLVIFYTFHTPTAKRLVLNTWRGIFVYTVAVGGFSVFGWPRIKSLVVSRDEGVSAEFDLAELAYEIAPTLTVCLLALIFVTILYVIVGWLERKVGEEF